MKLMMKAKCKWPYESNVQRNRVWFSVRCVTVSFSLYSRPFFDRRMGQEIDGAVMGDDYKGYTFKITGGNDQQGFAMKQGIMKNGRVRILFKKSK